MKIIDLTHLINDKILVYPNTVKPTFKTHNTIEKDGFFELKMTLCCHTGTHVDAPCHMVLNSKSLEMFPLDQFVGTAMVIPCLGRDKIDLPYLQRYETKIATVDFILFYTGWQEKWNTPAYFDNFPVLTAEATNWLTEFNLKAVGFDTISTDGMTEPGQPNHQILLGKEILIIENMTHLDQLPETTFQFHCAPVKIEGADGSPVRAYAVTESAN